MQKTIIYCDICKNNKLVKTEDMQVIFTTEQTEGRIVPPYLCIKNIDICEDCKNKVIEGKHIYGSGAMGYNDYHIK